MFLRLCTHYTFLVTAQFCTVLDCCLKKLSKYGKLSHKIFQRLLVLRLTIDLKFSISENAVLEAERILPIVYSDGTVLWIPTVKVKAACDMYLDDFPADKQTCGLKVGSWTHSGHTVSDTYL